MINIALIKFREPKNLQVLSMTSSVFLFPIPLLILQCTGLPGAGDELQGIKRGIIEVVDIIAINKADINLKLARQARAHLRVCIFNFYRILSNSFESVGCLFFEILHNTLYESKSLFRKINVYFS